jgi:hypothetical protein
MKQFFCSFFLLTLFLSLSDNTEAQNRVQDFRQMMEIPAITTIEASPTHLYVLSESEGLVVFRAYADSLTWLYSSTGMQRRGNLIDADIRFAYLYGNGRRLTVIEPTSVLGVYSSTILPEQPLAAERVANTLYLAFGNTGLGKISLSTPETVDTDPEIIFSDLLGNRPVNSLASDHATTLYVLTGNNIINVFQLTSPDGELQHSKTVQLDRDTHRLFLSGNELFGTDNRGQVFVIDANGSTGIRASVGEPVQKLQHLNDEIAIRTQSGKLWLGTPGDDVSAWKENTAAGNHFAVVHNRLWVAEFNQLSPIVTQSGDNTNRQPTASGKLQLKPINDIIIPFPRPVLIPFEFESGHSAADVEITYTSNITNAKIRGQSFYWQPTATQVGRHRFNVIANSPDGQTDSTSFNIDVRPFNSPPRFTPTRPMSISANELFELQISAVDPDGIDQSLIRYLGVDLPEGSRLDERTGLFRWTPSLRQVGTTRFQVIATDQFGSAASQDIEIKVVEISLDEEEEIEG